MKNLCLSLLLLTVMFVASSCGDDDGPSIDTSTYTATASINPSNFPAGIGLDFDAESTGRVVQLDDEPNLPMDLQIITYRTEQGGRPGVILFGDITTSSPVLAINVTSEEGVSPGIAGFNAFTQVTPTMIAGLEADPVFNFDPVTDVDAQGRADIRILQTAYNNLVIGNATIDLPPAEQPVFMIATRESLLYKFQIAERAQNGGITLRWARLPNGPIN